MRVLIIEDELGVSGFLTQGLKESGYLVDAVPDGRQGLEYALTGVYDVIVLDLMLPGMDGLTVLRELRAGGIQTPVLCLTARDGLNDRVRGLDSGADDYLVKPFAFPELLARLRALTRRPPLQQADAILRYDDLTLNPATREVTRGERHIDLTPREFSLLELLLRHPEQVLTRSQILEQVWDYSYYGTPKVVDVYIGYLRRKLCPAGERPLIHTVRGVGYRLGGDPNDA